MAWTPPRSWVTGELVTATLLNNHVRDNLNWVTRPVAIVATEKDVVSSTSTVDLLNSEVTIPAGYMGTKGVLRCRLIGDYKNNSGADRTLTLAIVFGGTTLWQDTTASLPADAARHDWVLEFEIANRSSAAVQFMSGVWSYSFAGSTTTGVGDLATVLGADAGPTVVPLGTNGTVAVNTAIDCALVVNATHSANNANLSIRREYASIELVGQAA